MQDHRHHHPLPHALLLLLLLVAAPLLLMARPGAATRTRHQDDLYHRPPPPPPPPQHTHYDSRAYLARVTQSGQVDVTNASTFDAYEHLGGRGGHGGRGHYLLGLPPHDFHDLHDLRFKQQPHRTWTARPRPEYEDDTTTRDPAIPENPEGLKDPSLLVGPWEEQPTVRVTNAVFKGVNGSVVGAQAGTVANLPCVIQNRADHETVSWIRLRDHHLITVGRQTYSQDDRFSVTYNRHRNEWTLHLRYVQARDAGEYVCQLSTHPPMTFISTLTITQASAEILGGPERYVQEGSSVLLNCSLRQHTQPPEYVFWYHNRTMINFDTNRQVYVRKTKDGSILTLAAVGKTDSGNYTCHPANARHASITLHIIAGDAPAAMQVSGTRRPFPHILLQLLPLLLLPLSALLGAMDVALHWDT